MPPTRKRRYAPQSVHWSEGIPASANHSHRLRSMTRRTIPNDVIPLLTLNSENKAANAAARSMREDIEASTLRNEYEEPDLESYKLRSELWNTQKTISSLYHNIDILSKKEGHNRDVMLKNMKERLAQKKAEQAEVFRRLGIKDLEIHHAYDRVKEANRRPNVQRIHHRGKEMSRYYREKPDSSGIYHALHHGGMVTWSQGIPSNNRQNLRARTRRTLTNENLQQRMELSEPAATAAASRSIRTNIAQTTALDEALLAQKDYEILFYEKERLEDVLLALQFELGMLKSEDRRQEVEKKLADTREAYARITRMMERKWDEFRHYSTLYDAVKEHPHIRAITQRANRLAKIIQNQPENTRERGARMTQGGTRVRQTRRVSWSSRIPSTEPVHPLPSRYPQSIPAEQIANLEAPNAHSPSVLAAKVARSRTMPRNTLNSIALNQAAESENQLYEKESAWRNALYHGHPHAHRMMGNTLRASRRAARNTHRAMKSMHKPGIANLVRAAEERTATYAAIPLDTRERGERITYGA